ncbi:MAG: glycerol-3-phosphate dehydrogenase [Verrucomicrobiales bacterium]|nr:glycerol-3-phosphate dehydrogenase [Verrucomicrobiales bacterium]
MIEKAAILGSGSWGTALAVALSDSKVDVTIYGNREDTCDTINTTHENPDYLPGIKLPETIVATTEIKDVCDKPLILMVVPSQVARAVLTQLLEAGLPEETILVSCTKGIDPGTGKLMHELMSEIFPNNPTAVLSGPSHAEEVAKRAATLVTVGSDSTQVAEAVQEVFTLPWFRSYTTDDVVGIEVGGVVKNVFAIAAGAADGLGLGDNAKAAMVTRGLAEMTRLGVAMGAREETFRGLSGVGDVIVTCYSEHSRNNRVGKMIGQGKTLQEAIDAMNQVAEGVPNAKNAYELAHKLKVRTPLIDQVYAVLYEDKPALKALQELLQRDPRSETD